MRRECEALEQKNRTTDEKRREMQSKYSQLIDQVRRKFASEEQAEILDNLPLVEKVILQHRIALEQKMRQWHGSSDSSIFNDAISTISAVHEQSGTGEPFSQIQLSQMSSVDIDLELDDAMTQTMTQNPSRSGITDRDRIPIHQWESSDRGSRLDVVAGAHPPPLPLHYNVNASTDHRTEANSNKRKSRRMESSTTSIAENFMGGDSNDISLWDVDTSTSAMPSTSTAERQNYSEYLGAFIAQKAQKSLLRRHITLPAVPPTFSQLDSAQKEEVSKQVDKDTQRRNNPISREHKSKAQIIDIQEDDPWAGLEDMERVSHPQVDNHPRTPPSKVRRAQTDDSLLVWKNDTPRPPMRDGERLAREHKLRLRHPGRPTSPESGRSKNSSSKSSRSSKKGAREESPNNSKHKGKQRSRSSSSKRSREEKHKSVADEMEDIQSYSSDTNASIVDDIETVKKRTRVDENDGHQRQQNQNDSRNIAVRNIPPYCPAQLDHPNEQRRVPMDKIDRSTISDSCETPSYKYVSVVRNKADRAKLKGHDCEQCNHFIQQLRGALWKTEEERQKLINQYSRHRHLHSPPKTPPDFWEVDFLDVTQDQNASEK